jgi:hypothetical protein
MKMINWNQIALGAGILSLGAAFGVTTSVQAAPRNNDVREERREVKQARKEVRQERRDVRKADTAAERRQQQRELQNARQDVRRERQDVREERRENRASVWNNRPVYNAPRPGYGNTNNYGYGNNTISQSDFRQFNGYSLGNSSGNTFQVRADNGTTYTVQSNTYSYRGQRVSVAGYLYNGVIVNARVSRF